MKNSTLPEMKNLTFQRTFSAPRALVFKAWLDPKMMAEWWGPQGFTNPRCELDARVGGKIHIDMCGPDGTIYPMTGEFKEITEPERLVMMCYVPDGKGGHLLEVQNTAVFEVKGDTTKLTNNAKVVHAVAGASGMIAGMEAGWTGSLERLKTLVEKP